MQVEVNEANIDRFKLVELTGNTREFMLSKAADAAEEGYVLSCDVPDAQVLEQNVFDVYESEHVDPRRLNGCGYEKREDTVGGEHWVCIIHGKTSRHDVAADSHVPCLQVDPDIKSHPEAMDSSFIPEACAYTKLDDPLEGTVYICAVHGKTSKHDISRVPSMPCLHIDPMTHSEGDPHRP